ncbi:MAG TPA: hypothetical protein VGV88_13770 [Candidatus Dormibacteraeota bacterium]|nr:hypothetical protein [Candidatus Dormibacteraeota bacterium]
MRKSRVFVFVLAGAVMCLSACDLPFGIGSATTRALENGAVASLQQVSFEVGGVYTQTVVAPPPPIVSGARVSTPAVGTRWNLDLQLTGQLRRMTVSNAEVKLEAIVLPQAAYFSGQAFLLQLLGGDPQTRDLARAAGNAWWRGPGGLLPQLVDFTSGAAFRTTFLGPAISSRTDHVSVDGADAVELSGPRADVFIASESPYRLLRVATHKRVTIDGIGETDLHYSNYGKNFDISAPNDVIDFSNLSTLPPIYTVISVDTSKCSSPCVVSALLKNLGGPTGAVSPSTITFTITDPATKAAAGSCTATVSPDVGFNATTTASCTIALNSPPPNAAVVTATPNNPGRG